MIRCLVSCRVACLAAAVLFSSTPLASAAFVTPTAGDSRFGWDFGDPQTIGAGWDNFTIPYLGTNLPDVTAANFGSGANSTVVQNLAPSAFITGGSAGNIYSFGEVTGFVVSIDASDFAGLVGPSKFTAQWSTLGTELDYANLLLTVGGSSFAPTFTEELARTPLGGFGGEQVVFLASWDLPTTATSYTLEFASASSSMSLGALQVDGFASAIPEPASGTLLAALVVGATAVRRRRR